MQFMGWTILSRTIYGPHVHCSSLHLAGSYNNLAWTAKSVNLHMDRKAMFYLKHSKSLHYCLAGWMVIALASDQCSLGLISGTGDQTVVPMLVRWGFVLLFLPAVRPQKCHSKVTDLRERDLWPCIIICISFTVKRNKVLNIFTGEAGVPFFHASGSDFDEMFVGSGAARVRKLFGQYWQVP